MPRIVTASLRCRKPASTATLGWWKLLLKAGADANTFQAEGQTALMTAAQAGSADAVKALLDHGAEVNSKESWRGQTALMWATAENHPAVVAGTGGPRR